MADTLSEQYKVVINFSLFKLNHKVSEIAGIGLYCSKEPLKTFRTDCPADCGAAETYRADEGKMAAPPR